MGKTNNWFGRLEVNQIERNDRKISIKHRMFFFSFFSFHSGLLSGLTGLFNQGPQQFDNTPTCHSILDPQYSLFSDICGVVPQARYSLPNYFGHVERWQIAQALTTLLGPSNPSSGNPSCARSLKLLVCPLLFPPCKTGRRELPPVLPCQPFCRGKFIDEQWKKIDRLILPF